MSDYRLEYRIVPLSSSNLSYPSIHEIWTEHIMPWQKTLYVPDTLPGHQYPNPSPSPRSRPMNRAEPPSTLPQNGKGMHLVTDVVVRECAEGLRGVETGIFMLHCMHTSAGLTVSRRGVV
jgi:hypothetical protein